jgi:hypothetical protein
MNGMKMYADTTGRRTAQILADVAVLVWVALWSWCGRVVHDTTLQLLGPAQRLESAGSTFGSTMQDAGSRLRQVPLVGEDLQGPFQRAAGTGTAIRDAGQQLGVAVGHLATVLGLVTAVVPIVLVVGVWLALRLRFVRRATAAQRFLDAAADLDLFALRALAGQPMHRLARVSDDPAGGWRSQDPAVVRALALLELRDCGLRPPPAQPLPA